MTDDVPIRRIGPSLVAGQVHPPIRLLDEAEGYVVVDKPSLLAVHPSRPDDTWTMWDGLRELLAYEIANGARLSIITRLDRETSGITLVALQTDTARRFHEAIKARRFEKEYLAIVHGWPQEAEWTVDAPILRQGDRTATQIYLKQMVHADGAEALTHFTVMAHFLGGQLRDTRFALIRVKPKTGRMHQIRVHLAHSGHPIVGDKLYGQDERCYLEMIETGWTDTLAAKLLLRRHALHAALLTLPEAGLQWQSPIPDDMDAFLRNATLCGNEGFYSPKSPVWFSNGYP